MGSSADLYRTKAPRILEACRQSDLAELTALATSRGGFLTDELRQQAWPILLGASSGAATRDGIEAGSTSDEAGAADSWKRLPRHRDEDQVQLDVNRAFIYYPNPQVPSELERRKGELSDLIVSVLRRNPWLCYFQGYHDICQVFLLVLCPLKPPIATTTSTIATAAAVPVHILNLDGTPDGAALPPGPTTVPAFAPPMPAPPPTSDPAQLAVTATCLTRLSALRIRDFMLPSLSPAVAQLRLIPQIVALADPELWDRLRGTEPFFALSGTLTMFAHDVTRLQDIARLFDALLARGAVYSVYVFAQLVLARRSELLAVPLDEPDILHWTLSRLPQHAGASSSSEDAGEKSARQPPELDLDALVADAAELQRRYPPESLPSWRGGVVTTALALAGALNRAAAASAGARRGQGRGGSGSAYGTAALTISPSSVLKTAAEPDMCVRQTVRDGEAYFDRQVRELEAAEWREEKAAEVWVAVNSPAARAAVGISLAVAVGAVAYWISRR